MDGVYERKFVKNGPVDGIIYVKPKAGPRDTFPVIISPSSDMPKEGEMVSLKNYINDNTGASFPRVVYGEWDRISEELMQEYFKLVNEDLHDRIKDLEEQRDHERRLNKDDAQAGGVDQEPDDPKEKFDWRSNANYWYTKWNKLDKATKAEYDAQAGGIDHEPNDPALHNKIANATEENKLSDEDKKSTKFLRDDCVYWYKEYEKELNNNAPKKGRKVSFMKKAAILLILGALVGNIPFSEITEGTKEFFSGSDTVLTGQYQTVSVCAECKENFGAVSRVAICGQCGSDNIDRIVAAELYRERPFPMFDSVVGTRFCNDDGTTTIVLDDGDTIIKEEL